MSNITIGIILFIALLFIIKSIFKQIQLNCLIKASNQGDTKTVHAIIQAPLTRAILTDYVCDLYMLKSLYQSNDNNEFEKLLVHMLKQNYKVQDMHHFLELYFHIFVLKQDQYYASLLLDAIKHTNDTLFIQYTTWTYQVIFDQSHDLIHEMNNAIDTKKYNGFSLGVILYMIAKQYEYINDKQNAYLYYYNAKLVFQPSSLYYPSITSKLTILKPDVDVSKNKN